MPNQRQPLENLSRRDFLKYGVELGGGALASILIPSVSIAQDDKVQITDTFAAGREIRERYIEQRIKGKKPSYVSIAYNTPKLLDELRTKFGLDTSDGYVVLFPMDSKYKGKSLQQAPFTQWGNGANTKLIVLEQIFEDPLKKAPVLKNFSTSISDLYKDHELIVENELMVYPFKFADYLRNGLPKYPAKSFQGPKGEINYSLFMTLIRLLPYHYSFMAYVQSPRFKDSLYLKLAAYSVEKACMEQYSKLSDARIIKDTDPNLIEKIKREFAPQKLFPSPNTIINL